MKSIVALYVLLFTAVVLCASLTVYAQEYPRSELTGAYSYIRTDEDIVDLNQFGLTGTANRHGANLNGWNAAATLNLESWVGIVADFGGAYGSITYSATGVGSTSPGVRLHTFLFGPQFYRRGDKVTLFGRAMVGFAKINQDSLVPSLLTDFDQTTFGAGFGGGVDIHLNKRVSLRALQVDYILTRFDNQQGFANSTQHLIRASTGFTLRN